MPLPFASEGSFRVMGGDHLAALAVILVLALTVVRVTRRDPASTAVRKGMRVACVLMVINSLVWQVEMVVRGIWSWEDSLPLHLCDASNIAAMIVLWKPGRLGFELVYFWGLGGALQALMTPELREGFPDYDFLQYFATHGAIVCTGVFLAWGLRMTPRRGAIWRVLLWTNVVAVPAGIANLLTGGNYFYLREPPTTGSLLDYLGPWPWYILTGQFVALLFFFLLDLPFRRRDRDVWPWPPAGGGTRPG